MANFLSSFHNPLLILETTVAHIVLLMIFKTQKNVTKYVLLHRKKFQYTTKQGCNCFIGLWSLVQPWGGFNIIAGGLLLSLEFSCWLPTRVVTI